ncbi:MAG TPA: DinB family protein [Fimbriimonadaceae bacterium]|nr:DinB family protein [Fimbriimonadaceae bacterium]
MVESLVESSKVTAVEGMEYFLRNFSFVPDDKLTWTPAPTAKSAIRIAAHTALYAGIFAQMMRDRKLPFGDEIPAFVARNEAAETMLIDRAEMERVFRRNTDAVIDTLDDLTPEAIDIVFDAALGFSVPMRRLMNMPGWHATLHAGQIDFLQTCWDDQEIYF